MLVMLVVLVVLVFCSCCGVVKCDFVMLVVVVVKYLLF